MTHLPLLLALACKPGPTGTEGDPVHVVSTAPADGARDVPIDSSIRITFDGPIDVDQLDADRFLVIPSLPGALRWDEPSLTATFDPTGNLLQLTPYTVRLLPELGIAEETVLRFTTGGPATVEPPDATVSFDADRVTVSVDGTDLRTYTLSSTHPQRDNGPSTRTFAEADGKPRLRSGSPLFDALFSLAIHEAEEASVSEIRDGGFQNGGGVPCPCFETGEKWTYVWTRDTSYAAWLGLWAVDPRRTRDSLLFKLSAPKGGGGEQIVQDTGSGGSWPVSSDRVVWALAAREVEKALPEPERTAFRERAFQALINTLEHDRTRLWDPADGLYRGEQSFLDWREQSYPAWTAADVVPIAESRSLSTNTAHYGLLRTAAAWGAAAGHPRAATWATWADDLGRAMRDAFWRGADDMPISAMTLGPFNPTPLDRGDHLGVALSVLEGVFSPEQGAQAIAAWPHTPYGPPVIWPQQPSTAIYHNRSIWPFVTAYGAMAAAKVGNEAVFDHDVTSLVRGAALNLSNMENLEFLTGRPWVEAGAESGPVVNSRRQLWSVGGYVAMVVRGLFGVSPDETGIRVQPFLTPGTHAAWLGGATELSLLGLTWQDREIDVFLHLPEPGEPDGRAYVVEQVALDGDEVADGLVPTARVANGSRIDITLVDPELTSDATLRVEVDNGDFRRFWPPPSPPAPGLRREGDGLVVSWTSNPEADVHWDLWRDGVRIADHLPTPVWTDGGADPDGRSACYTVTAVYTSSGLASQPSPPSCWWGAGSERVLEVDAWGLRQARGDGVWSEQHGRAHYMDWGDPDDALELAAIRPRWTGLHRVQLVYGNGAGPINTGITCAVKRVRIYDAAGALVHEGTIAMPHLADWARWEESTTTDVELQADQTYSILIEDDWNMSYFAHFTPYTGGLGGGAGSFNRVNIHALRLLAMEGDLASPVPPYAVSLDGTDDIGAYSPEQRLGADAMGAPLQPWSDFALDWDDDFFYLTLVSSAFEDDYAPWMVYLEAIEGDPGAATAADGMTYARGSVTGAARLPFTPTHLLALRAAPGVGPDAGPWSGLYQRESASWLQLHRLRLGRDLLLAGDRHTLSARISRHALGDPTQLRLAAHVVWGVAGGEWKDVVPAAHAPWSDGGGHLLIDLGGEHAASAWGAR